MDIGLGLILGVLLRHLTTMNYGVCLAIGVVATLLPDLDYIWKALVTKRLPHSEHRDGLHYPLLFIPTVGLLGSIISPAMGLIFAFGGVLHFLHDSVGIGFGVKWLYPFRNRSYLFLFQIKTPTNGGMPKRRFYSWSDAERDDMIRKYAYRHWIQYVYLRPNPFGLFEYSVLLIGVAVAVFFG